ncbi:phytochrome C-like [Tripterygium wilfordii]|uniref:phytochrome C-like n=1 Tax=Tripterygium wilfordii TaxID=458696 RepID=UPI0018F802F5|nr:phytochrome C-like [Tripterygium wilfordii]
MAGIEERTIRIKLKTFGPGKSTGICFIAQDLIGQKMILGKYTCLQGDYVGILRNPCALIPPIFMADEHGRCFEWNDAMQKLSGLTREEAMEKMLLGEERMQTKLLFGLFDRHGNYVEALLFANRRTDAEGRMTGVLCFLHVTCRNLTIEFIIFYTSKKINGINDELIYMVIAVFLSIYLIKQLPCTITTFNT